jgi:hypothetical protein
MSFVGNNLVEVTLRYRNHLEGLHSLEGENYLTPPPTILERRMHVEATVTNLTSVKRSISVRVDSPCFSHWIQDSFTVDAGETSVRGFVDDIPPRIEATWVSAENPIVQVRVMDPHTSPTPDETLMDWITVDELTLLDTPCSEGDIACFGEDEYVCLWDADAGSWFLSRAGACLSPVCLVEGERKCVGDDEMTCENGQWVLTGPGVCASGCITGEKRCIGEDEFTCENGQWVLTGMGACGTAPCIEGAKRCIGDDEFTCQSSQWVLTGPGKCAPVTEKPPYALYGIVGAIAAAIGGAVYYRLK